MADRKNPVFLRVMIVVVALLLGFSLNMFQFRNPFRSTSTDPANTAQFQDKTRFPSRQETPLPVSPATKPSQPENAPQNGSKAVQPEIADEAEVKIPQTGAPAAVPQAVADASPAKAEKDKDSVPVSIAVEHDSSALAAPKVTSDAAKAKAAKIGRQVATGVSGSQPEPQKAADAPASAQAAPAAPSANPGEDKAAIAAPSGKTQQKDSGKPEPAASDAAPAQAAKSAPPAEQSAQAAPAAQTSQTGQVPQAAGEQSGGKAAADAEKSSAAKGSKILEIKVQDKPGEFVLNIVTDGPVDRVTSFHSKGPARLAVDFQGNWQSSLGTSIPVEGDLFERIRVGAHPDKLRLVIDYRDKEMSAFSEQIVEKQPKGVVIRIPKAKPKS